MYFNLKENEFKILKYFLYIHYLRNKTRFSAYIKFILDMKNYTFLKNFY